MRFSFRRKDNRETTDETTQQPSYSGLGLFSPVVESTVECFDQDYRKLAEMEEILVRTRKIKSLDDVSDIVDYVRDGNILLLDITRLNDGHDQGHLELKRIIERIRGETRCFRADIALVNDECIIVTPPFVRLGS